MVSREHTPLCFLHVPFFVDIAFLITGQHKRVEKVWKGTEKVKTTGTGAVVVTGHR